VVDAVISRETGGAEGALGYTGAVVEVVVCDSRGWHAAARSAAATQAARVMRVMEVLLWGLQEVRQRVRARVRAGFPLARE